MPAQLRIQHRISLDDAGPLPLTEYPWGDPAAGPAGFQRLVAALPDVVTGQRFHTFGDLVGQAVPAGLATVTDEDVEDQAAAGLVENFYLNGGLSLDAWAHGVTFRNFVVDAPALYGLNLFMAVGAQRPAETDRSDWPRFENFVIRGRAARQTWNGTDQTASCIYGGWSVIDGFEAYASKNGSQPVGPIDMRRGWIHWLHREGGDHNGCLQVRSGEGVKAIRDVRMEGFLRWRHGIHDPAATQLSGSAWQTGSQLSAIEHLLVENCYFDGGQYGFNGPPAPDDLDGWNDPGEADPDGYVKNDGWAVIAECSYGRGSGSGPVSSGPEFAHINDHWYDTGLSIGG